ERREAEHKAYMTKLKVEASNRAVLARQQQKQVDQREQRIQVREEARARRARETQFLTTVRGMAKDLDGGALEDAPASPKPALAALGDSAGPLASRALLSPESPLAKSMTRDGSELMDFHRTYEQQDARGPAKCSPGEAGGGGGEAGEAGAPGFPGPSRRGEAAHRQDARRAGAEEECRRAGAARARAGGGGEGSRGEAERSQRREELFQKLEAARQERERSAEA
ncbi:unnamed protein product, partial [Prorocentrum cordatum]